MSQLGGSWSGNADESLCRQMEAFLIMACVGEGKVLPGPPPALIHKAGPLWRRLGKPILRESQFFLFQASRRIPTQLRGGGK